MATRYAVQNATDWSSTASWSATQGGASGASVPVSGDTVWITVPVSFSAGLNQTAVDLAAMYITAGFSSGFIGGSGSSLTISGTRMDYSGTAPLYIAGGTAGIDRFNVYSGNAIYVNGGTFGDIITGPSGLLTINAGTISNLWAMGMGVTINSSAVISPGILVYGGVVTCNASLSTASVTVARGLFRLDGASLATQSVGVENGGIFRINTAGTQASLFVAPGGRVDANGSNYQITVTALTRCVGSYVLDMEPVPVTIGSQVHYGYA